MKKYIIKIIAVCVLTVLLFTSCNRYSDDITKHIMENMQQYMTDTLPAENTDNNKYKTVNTYKYYPNSDSTENIMSLNEDFIEHNGRIYYMQELNYKNDITPAYINIDNGSANLVCSDPLCPHNTDECIFYRVCINSEFYIDDDIVILARNNGYIFENEIWNSQIIQVDIVNNINKVIYEAVGSNGVNITIKHVTDDYIYFIENNNIKHNDDENGIYYTNTNFFNRYNRHTNKIETLSVIDDPYSTVYFITDSNIIMTTVNSLAICDLNLNILSEPVKYTADRLISDVYYDISEKTLYYRLCSERNYLSPGEIYKVNINDGLPERILSKNINVYSIQITDNYIYYTEYAPLSWGFDGENKEQFDYTGGKIYRINKDKTEASALIYDCSDEICIRYFKIIGNYIYAAYNKYMYNDGFKCIKFCKELAVARIDISENTVQYINIVN